MFFGREKKFSNLLEAIKNALIEALDRCVVEKTAIFRSIVRKEALVN